VTDTRVRISRDRPVRLDQLADEVGTALCASESEIVVADPDSPVTAAALRSALDAHTPVEDPDPAQEFADAVKAATTLDGLKAALLGIKGPGAEPRRPDIR
jgi:hypothetical protein